MKTKTLLNKIKRIEERAYPSIYRQMEEFETWKDIVSYCEAIDMKDIIILYGKEWYFIAVKSTAEIVDLAGVMTLADLFFIKRTIQKEFSGRTVKLDARESTSFRLVTKLGTITYDHKYEWGGEIFHEVFINI